MSKNTVKVGLLHCRVPADTVEFLAVKVRSIVLRVARNVAEFAAVRRVARRAELRARAFSVIAADRGLGSAK